MKEVRFALGYMPHRLWGDILQAQFLEKETDKEFFFPRECKIPNLNPSNPKMNLPKKVLKKLPISVAKLVGPMLVRYIP